MKYKEKLGKAKLIYSLLSGIFENHMQAAGQLFLFHNMKMLKAASIKQKLAS